jgi:hypothetical protein
MAKSDTLWSPKGSMYGTKRGSNLTPSRNSRSREKKLDKTSEKRKMHKSPSGESNTVSVEKMVEDFRQRENMDTLDLTAYSLSDTEIFEVLRYLRPIKKIKGLKLVKNSLTNEGLGRILELIPSVTNLNLSFNLLGEEALSAILSSRQQLPLLRIINISNNKINERKAKATVDELKRQGIIVTI